MESVNTLRMILVAGAVLAAVWAAVEGQWAAVAVLLLAVAVHGWLWLYLYRPGADGRRRADRRTPPAGRGL